MKDNGYRPHEPEFSAGGRLAARGGDNDERPADRIDRPLILASVAREGVLLVATYDAGLAAKLQAAAEPELGRPVSAAFVQLRQEQGRSSEAVRSLTERVTRLEARADDGAVIVRALTAPGLLRREAVAIDPQSRLVTIRRPAVDNPALETTLGALRAAFPDWQFADAAPAQEPPPTP